MTDDKPEDIDSALEGLLAFEKRITKYASDLLSDGNSDLLTADMLAAIGKVVTIKEYIDYLAVEIVDCQGGRGRAVALTVLNVLILEIELFFRVAVNDLPVEDTLASEAKKRAEYMRTFINRKPAEFYHAIVTRVFMDHVAAHGPWKDRPSKLSRKLKPEIDRLALSDGGKALELDTITRRLKVLMAPTQH